MVTSITTGMANKPMVIIKCLVLTQPMNNNSILVAPTSKAVDRLAGAISIANDNNRQITGINPCLKSLILSCFLLNSLLRYINKCQLGEVGSLESEVDDRQPDPAATLIQLRHPKKTTYI